MALVDAAFILPIEHRPSVNITDEKQIPVIDLSPISSLDHISDDNMSEDIVEVVKEVGEAIKKWGFFQVVNHGVPLEKVDKVHNAAREFFSLPLEEKRKVGREEEGSPMGYYDTEHTKNVRDWKEVFDFHAKEPTIMPITPDQPEKTKQVNNRWPDYPSELRDAAQGYSRELEKLGFKLLELVCLSLGLQANRLHDYFKDPTTLVRVNRYPSCPSPHLALGAGRHKDPGALTILSQDKVPGLEVRRKSDGAWARVNPAPGSFIINVGDIMEVWTNEKYDSVEHRVLVNSESDRISIVFFLNPSHYVMVKPLEELTDEQDPPKYREYNWGSFFETRLRGNFRKLHVDNIQISHFKIDE